MALPYRQTGNFKLIHEAALSNPAPRLRVMLSNRTVPNTRSITPAHRWKRRKLCPLHRLGVPRDRGPDPSARMVRNEDREILKIGTGFVVKAYVDIRVDTG